MKLSINTILIHAAGFIYCGAHCKLSDGWSLLQIINSKFSPTFEYIHISAMIVLLLTLSFLLGIFLVLKKKQNKQRKQNLPPGPWGLPLFGHLVSLGLNPHLTLMKWKKKYGPIIQIRFGSFPGVQIQAIRIFPLCKIFSFLWIFIDFDFRGKFRTVVLGNSKVTKEAFNMMEFSGRPAIQALMENNLAKSLGFSEGDYNTELRQFTIRKLKEFGMGRKTLEGQIQEGISEFMDFIKMREGLPIKSADIPSSHIVKTVWSILMTEELNPEDAEELNRTVKNLSELGSVLSELAGFMPCMENLNRKFSFGHFSLISTRSNQLKELYSFFAKPLDEKNKNQAKDGDQTPVDIMDFYLQKLKKQRTNPPLFTPHVSFYKKNDSAQYVLGDLFTGAIHTVHTTLTWMLNFMAKNPEAQLKLQAEIDEVVGNSRLPSLADQGQMPYADAVVNEVLRITPPLPLGVPHKTTADVRFHGYDIKKDTMIFTNLYGIHHDPEAWGDPENFRPERWLGEQGKKLKSEHVPSFSTGRRNCPGEALAREQLFLYVTTLFQKYSVKFYGRTPEAKAVFGIFLAPSKFTVVFNQRKINKL